MLGEQQLEEGDFYLSPEGYKVFTEQFHLKRGYCCESGCRHFRLDLIKIKRGIKFDVSILERKKIFQ